MLQKYEIIKDNKQQKLKIREYAIIDKRLKNVSTELLRPEDYTFLHEEIYEAKAIFKAISKGIIDLVVALRTPIFFPNAANISVIAESVINLYDAKNKKAVELIFNDGAGHSTADIN